MKTMAYLDNNATTPIRPQALDAAHRAMQVVGNPSSVHGAGRAAKRLIEDARQDVAHLLGAKSKQVIFTSGATEANNLALINFAQSHRVLVSAIEHDSILQAGFDMEIIPVLPSGQIDLEALEILLAQTQSDAPSGRQTLVSVMGVNNETGGIQPVEAVWNLARKYNALSHCDAVQMVGKLEINFEDGGPDLLSISSHKIGGPRGVGALIADPNLELLPLIRGGGQEKNRRAGTENVAGIAGFGAAAKVAIDALDSWGEYKLLRDQIEGRLKQLVPDMQIIGTQAPRVGTTTNLALPGIKAETQVMAMDLAGVAVSAGAACSSGKVKTSHVLSAMGYAPDVAGSAIRVSLGWTTTAGDIDKFIEAYTRFANKNSSAGLIK